MKPDQPDKLYKAQLKRISDLGAKLRMRFSIKQVQTWNDIYNLTGYSEEYLSTRPELSRVRNEQVKLPDINSWVKQLEHEFNTNWSKKAAEGIKETLHNIVNQPKRENDVHTNLQEVVQSGQGSGVSAITHREQPTNIVGHNIPDQRLPQVLEEVPKVQTSNKEDYYNADNNYGLIPSPKEKCSLYYFQKKAAAEGLDKLLGLRTYKYRNIEELSKAHSNPAVPKNPKRAILIIAGPGSGKTFIVGAIDRRLKDINWHKDKTWGMTNYLCVTRNSVVEQTKRVNEKSFNIKHPVDTEVINIDALRARAGQTWVTSKNVIINGEEQVVWEWRPMLNPCVLEFDECQGAKNEDSQQHKIMVAFSEIQTPTIQIFYSATPFIRISDAKAFAIATRKDISHITGIPGSVLSLATWPTYAAAIAKGDPTEYNEAAVERLMNDLDDYIVRVKGVRWQFNAKNRVEIIDFEPPSEENDWFDAALYYDNAWKKYLERKAKLEEEVTDNPRFRAMIELAMFLAAAEYAKCYVIAKRMYNNVQAGYAAVAAVKQKATIIKIVKILNEKYGVPRDQISLIWGGGQTQLTAKQKMKAKINENKALFDEAGISLEDMALDQVEDRIIEDLPEHLRLGNQSKDERQREIDKFQCGKSLYAIFTFKAGGVGLSLHHTDEQTKEKCRRQPNGYAVLEDIPKIPTRPRKSDISTTWSPIDMVQGCGRTPRLTSLSDSEQSLLFYRGTVEEKQAFVVTHKLKCLSKVVRSINEKWQDLIVHYERAKEIAKDLVANSKLTEDTEEEMSEVLVFAEEREE